MTEVRRLTLPRLRARGRPRCARGDACTLTGPLFTLRDAGHVRLLEELHERGSLPYGLAGQTIFYAGPTPPAAGRPFGAVGATTASRMDFAARTAPCGHRGHGGQGTSVEAVRQACIDTESVYFAAVGGAAAFLAKCVESSHTISYDDLGTEALRRVVVRDLPVFVGIDTLGRDVYDARC